MRASAAVFSALPQVMIAKSLIAAPETTLRSKLQKS